MSLTRSIAHNTFAQAIGRLVSITLAFFVFILMARSLGVEQFGLYTTATAFLQFFSIVVDLGLYIYLAKTLGEPGVDEERLVSNVLTLRLTSAIVILGIAPLVILLFPYPTIVKLSVAALCLSSLFVTVTQVLAGVFQKRLKTGRYILAEVIGRVFLLAGVAYAFAHGGRLMSVVWLTVISAGVSCVITLAWSRHLVRFRLIADLALWKAILKTTWPIALSIMFNVVYFKADTIILSLFHSARDVGIYGAPYRVFEALISIPALFAGLLTPLLSAAYLTDRERFVRILQRGFEMLLAAAVPIVIGAQFVAADVMKLIAPEFVDSAPVLRILVLGTAAIFIGYLFSNAIVIVNRQRTMVWMYASVACTSIVLYVLTIPRFSYFGAAWVTAFVETAVAVIAAVVVLRTSGGWFSIGPSVRIIGAGAGMALVMVIVQPLPWYLIGTVGVGIYLALLLVMKVVDRATVRDIMSRGGV